MSEIVNAKITGTMLGIEDHGIMTAFVYLEWPAGGVGFGGYTLDGPPPKREPGSERVGTRYGMEFIANVLRVVGVDKWEDLTGKNVRVDTEGWGGKALRLGHIMEDKWFDPKELADRLKAQTQTVDKTTPVW